MPHSWNGSIDLKKPSGAPDHGGMKIASSSLGPGFEIEKIETPHISPPRARRGGLHIVSICIAPVNFVGGAMNVRFGVCVE